MLMAVGNGAGGTDEKVQDLFSYWKLIAILLVTRVVKISSSKEKGKEFFM